MFIDPQIAVQMFALSQTTGWNSVQLKIKIKHANEKDSSRRHQKKISQV